MQILVELSMFLQTLCCLHIRLLLINAKKRISNAFTRCRVQTYFFFIMKWQQSYFNTPHKVGSLLVQFRFSWHQAVVKKCHDKCILEVTFIKIPQFVFLLEMVNTLLLHLFFKYLKVKTNYVISVSKLGGKNKKNKIYID